MKSALSWRGFDSKRNISYLTKETVSGAGREEEERRDRQPEAGAGQEATRLSDGAHPPQEHLDLQAEAA